MSTEEKVVYATLVEYPCPCGKGVYRTVDERPLQTNPRQWKHRCSATGCNEERYFTVIYPLLRYRDKTFMLVERQRYDTYRQYDASLETKQ